MRRDRLADLVEPVGHGGEGVEALEPVGQADADLGADGGDPAGHHDGVSDRLLLVGRRVVEDVGMQRRDEPVDVGGQGLGDAVERPAGGVGDAAGSWWRDPPSGSRRRPGATAAPARRPRARSFDKIPAWSPCMSSVGGSFEQNAGRWESATEGPPCRHPCRRADRRRSWRTRCRPGRRRRSRSRTEDGWSR